MEWFDKTYRPHLKVETDGDEPSAIFDFHTARLPAESRVRLLVFAEALMTVLGDRRSGLSSSARIGGAGLLMALHHALIWLEQEAVTHEAVDDWATVESFVRAKYADAHEDTIRGMAEMELLIATVGFWEVDARHVIEKAKRQRPLAMSASLRQLSPQVRKELVRHIPDIKLTETGAAAGCLLVSTFVLVVFAIPIASVA